MASMDPRVRKALGKVLAATNDLRDRLQAIDPQHDAPTADRLTAALIAEGGVPVSVANHLGFGNGLEKKLPLDRKEAEDLAWQAGY